MPDQEQVDEVVNGLNSKNYWIIQPIGVEGQFLTTKIMKLYYDNINQADGHVVIASTRTDQWPIYYLRKTMMTSEQLSKIIGNPPADLEKGKMVKLFVKTPEGLPKPTVQGWGEA